jgi:hypothetical protein
MKYYFGLLMALSFGAQAQCFAPAVLDDALRLVLSANPVLSAQYDEYQETSRAKDWDAYVRVGYAIEATQDDAAGPNASLQVKIPLFGSAHKREVAKARTVWHKAQETVSKGFLTDLEKLCTKAAKVRELSTMVEFYRNRLEYTTEQEKEGVVQPDALWSATEKAQLTIHDHERESGELAVLQQTIARQYGGEQWPDLLTLIASAWTK